MGSGAIMIEVVRGYGKFSKYRSVIVMENYLGGDIAHYIKRFDDHGECIWSIDNLRGHYRIVPFSNVGELRGYREKETFLEAIREKYPEDLEFFLWNQDAFVGKINQELSKCRPNMTRKI
jgi:hypothetical protein